MSPYLLALDLDGTACNDKGRLGEKTRYFLKRARERGHIVCFVSGRRDVDMVKMKKDCQYAEYIVLNNGGKLIRAGDDKVLFNERIDEETSGQLISYCLEHGYQLHILNGMYWAINRWNEGLGEYVRELGVEPVLYRSLQDIPCKEVEGFTVTVDRVSICRYIDDMHLPLSHVPTEPGCSDIMRRGVTKWSGLSHLMHMLNIPRSRVIAAGNFNNDLEMIQNAGIGVAVQNAVPDVKSAADYVTPNDNNHDAVADIVERFLL